MLDYACFRLVDLDALQNIRTPDEIDADLLASGLSPDQQFLVAHSTRSYYGSTQLLDVAGRPAWVVNEGEYCMMNTLDLSVDQCFWELDRNPWVVRNVLDQFLTHYSYVDEVKIPNGEGGHDLAPGGLSFCHDMGVHNNFSPPGESSYELPDLTGCFSYMTQEQLCNWVLTAACYVAKTGDRAWATRHAGTFRECYLSMRNRQGDGEGDWMRHDSARCGTGAEITTYDSLDESLGQARNNLYIAVKRWAAYAGLRLLAIGINDTLAHEAGQRSSTCPQSCGGSPPSTACSRPCSSRARRGTTRASSLRPRGWSTHSIGRRAGLARWTSRDRTRSRRRSATTWPNGWLKTCGNTPLPC